MVKQKNTKVTPVEVAPSCDDKRKAPYKWDECQCAQVCEMVKAYNRSKKAKKRLAQSPSNAPGTAANRRYNASITNFCSDFAALVAKHHPNVDHPSIKKKFYSPPAGKPPPKPPPEDCVHAAWKKQGGGLAQPKRGVGGGFQPDHMHRAGLNGGLTVSNLKWADAEVNGTVGPCMDKTPAPKKMKAHPSCC